MAKLNQFEVEQEVGIDLIKDQKIKGVIIGCLKRAFGQVDLYEVEWADLDGCIHSRWFTGAQLSE